MGTAHIAGGLFSHYVDVDTPRFLVVLEESEDFQLLMRDRLQEINFIVVPAYNLESWDLYMDYDVFVLDVNLGPSDSRGGLIALQRVKENAKKTGREVWCAIVSELASPDSDVRSKAFRFGADQVFTKSPGDLAQLSRELNKQYLKKVIGEASTPGESISEHRSNGTGDSPDEVLEKIGLILRSRPNPILTATARLEAVRLEFTKLMGLASSWDSRVLNSAEAIILDSTLRAAFQIARVVGDGFGMVVSALRTALVNRIGLAMKREEAQAWLAVVLEVREQPLVRPDDAVELCERLEEAGWDTSPLGAVDLLDMVARMTLKKG